MRFYRPWEPSESLNLALIDMNGSYVGAAENGNAFYRDVDLRQDVDNFVVPDLRDIGIQLASIVEKRVAGIYTEATTKALIDSEEDAIQTLVETMAALAILEAQTIVNAIVDALNKAVNTALVCCL